MYSDLVRRNPWDDTGDGIGEDGGSSVGSTPASVTSLGRASGAWQADSVTVMGCQNGVAAGWRNRSSTIGSKGSSNSSGGSSRGSGEETGSLKTRSGRRGRYSTRMLLDGIM